MVDGTQTTTESPSRASTLESTEEDVVDYGGDTDADMNDSTSLDVTRCYAETTRALYKLFKHLIMDLPQSKTSSILDEVPGKSSWTTKVRFP